MAILPVLRALRIDPVAMLSGVTAWGHGIDPAIRHLKKCNHQVFVKESAI
jgi:hypothetical protein